ncbi:recombinase RecA, partial [Campylobacter coli]
MSKDNPQMATMKSTYEDQKKQFAQLPKDSQEAACKPALEQMKQVMQAMPK